MSSIALHFVRASRVLHVSRLHRDDRVIHHVRSTAPQRVRDRDARARDTHLHAITKCAKHDATSLGELSYAAEMA